MELIRTENVTKIYEDGAEGTPAIRGVSFSIRKGEFIAIMGPSGSGKSTLLHVLGFLDRQTSGKYWFHGKSFDEHSGAEIARVRNEKMGFVFQAFNLLPRASVLENVKLPLLYSSVPDSQWEEQARKSVDSVGLSHRMNHEAYRLSGGEKQRVAIARALVNNPEVIFADEPTGNLDSKSGAVVMDILQKLNETDKHTVILITHETYTAEHAERIIRIHDGEIASDAPVDGRHRIRGTLFK
ncbi:MAG TPA: ABC transporter ATP-binding protein [Candidatus Paceibacterota bacterium]